MKAKKLLENFWWVGVLDPNLRVFDIVMRTEQGTSYNSYLLKGSEKTILFETAKATFFDEFIAKIEEVVPVTDIDILVVDHTEPDHAGSVEGLLKLNPNLQILGSAGAISFLKEIVNVDFDGRVVADGETLDIGGKTLRFIAAPNLHWPDTIFTYIEEDGILVSCDAFGAHFAYDGIVNDENIDEAVLSETRKYYFDNIMGPFKADVLRACTKLEGLDIKLIANGHGPVLTREPNKVIELYKQWASEVQPFEKKTVAIVYVSAYGYTKALAEKIAEGIRGAGDIDTLFFDLVEDSQADALSAISRADGFLLGTPTIVGEALPPIWDILSRLTAKEVAKKPAGAFGSYGWSGEAVPHIVERLEQLKVNLIGGGLKVRFKPSEAQLDEAFEYGKTFAAAILGEGA